MKTSAYRILVVDDEEDLCEILQFNLNGEGYETDVAYSAEEAISKDISKYDLILLDVMMAEMSGFRLAEKIRKKYKLNIPIIFITAKDTENDLLTGYSVGGDDYIAKPFSIREVLARVNAVLRRSDSKPENHPDSPLIIDEMEFYPETKILQIDNIEINLTKKEIDILHLLMRNMGRYYTRNEIIQIIWPGEVIVSDRTVDVHITRLRNKIGRFGKCLKSKSGYGYKFQTS